MHTQLMKHFQITPDSMTLTVTFTLKIADLDFAVAGGIRT